MTVEPDGDKSIALTGIDGSEIVFETERASPVDRGAFEKHARRNGGREPPHLRELGKQVQIRNAREAVGANRDAYAGFEEFIDRRGAGAGTNISSRAGHERCAGGRKALELRRGNLDAVHHQHSVVEKPHPVEILDRARPRGNP